MTDEPDAGKTSAAVDGVVEEMKRQRVGAARNSNIFLGEISPGSLSGDNDESHSLAAAVSSTALRSLHTHTHRRIGADSNCCYQFQAASTADGAGASTTCGPLVDSGASVWSLDRVMPMLESNYHPVRLVATSEASLTTEVRSLLQGAAASV